MKINYNSFFKLIKVGIVVFVILTSSCGYLLGLESASQFGLAHYLMFILGSSLISSGSLALNEVQEWTIDAKMNRTLERPIPMGLITPRQGLVISLAMLFFGFLTLFFVSKLTALVGLVIIFFYNYLYTQFWKKTSPFAAIPGAIPGALPFVMGYAANSNNIFSTECVMGFLVMFFWQMPHFWVLAIKYLDDYKKGGIPVLPAVKGIDYTIQQIKIYMVIYLGVSFVWFMLTPNPLVAALLILPMSLKMILEFIHYSKTPTKWLGFFMWTNVSVLVFLFFPVISKWYGF